MAYEIETKVLDIEADEIRVINNYSLPAIASILKFIGKRKSTGQAL